MELKLSVISFVRDCDRNKVHISAGAWFWHSALIDLSISSNLEGNHTLDRFRYTITPMLVTAMAPAKIPALSDVHSFLCIVEIPDFELRIILLVPGSSMCSLKT